MPDEMIYAPAKRGNIGVLIMLAGSSGSGKTKSALRLATGLANGGPIGFCDTERGRGLYYADEFDFLHLRLDEPFTPRRFEAAALASQKGQHAVWICDSFSAEHVGPGGVLDMQEANLKKMAGDDWNKRETMKYTAWIEPKGQHKHLLARLWQLNMHVILCCQAEKKLDLIKNEKGKTVPNPDSPPTPLCGSDIPYAMTASFLFDAKRPGVPIWLKKFDKLVPLVNTNAEMDEDTGRRIAAWARGEAIGAPSSQPGSSVRQPAQDPAPQTKEPSKPDLLGHEGGGPSKNEIVAGELVHRFEATKTRADHFAIVDEKADRDRIQWFKQKQPELYDWIRTAQEESWKRTEAKPEEPKADEAA